MRNRTLRLNKQELHIIVLALACVPALASADWLSTLQTWGSNIRLGMYALGGSVAVTGLVWSGIQWLFSRMAGDRSHGFMDYFKDVGVIVVVGGALVLGAAAWQIFGSGTPA